MLTSALFSPVVTSKNPSELDTGLNCTGNASILQY